MAPGDKKFYNVYVGTETGILKGVSINAKENYSKNFHRLKSLSKENEITALNWTSESEILFGTRDQRVSGFDPSDNSFTHGRRAEDGLEGSNASIVGLGRLPDETLVTAYQNGIVKVWRSQTDSFNVLEAEVLLNSTNGRKKKRKVLNDPNVNPETAEKAMTSLKKGKNLRCMKLRGNLLATGGREHNLHILNLEGNALVFRAKNVPPDMLQLRVPVWISDLIFLEDNILSTVSRHSHIRLYDIRAQRRPVVSFGYPQEEPLTCMSGTNEGDKRILVATAQGGLAMYDLRMGLKGMVRKYKGSVGSIRSLAYENGFFAAVGLDRFLRIYNLENRAKHSRMYLKSRLNHVVLRKGFDPDFQVPEVVEEHDVIEILDNDDEIEWSDMEIISEELTTTKKKKKKKTAEKK